MDAGAMRDHASAYGSRDEFRPDTDDIRSEAVAGTWWLSLVSLTAFFFALTGLTGVLMALTYAPNPAHALDSVRYIESQPFGALLRGIHYFAASALVITLGLHLLRLLLTGGYRKPKAAAWCAGVGLFVLVSAFLATGDVLPHDQKAYWDLVVRGQYAEALPLIGPAVKRILLGGDAVGITTLQRMFVAHAVLLPSLAVPLLLFWLRSTRAGAELKSKGNASLRSELSPPPYPSDQAFRDVTACFLALGILAFLTRQYGVYTEGPPNPSAPYVPRPDWYFLPLYQLARLEIGGSPVFTQTWLATVVIPGLMVLGLLLLPFIRLHPPVMAKARTFVTASGCAAAAVTLWLGVAGRTVAAQERSKLPPPSPFVGIAEVGHHLFESKCSNCHRENGTTERKPGMGPDFVLLTSATNRPSSDDDFVMFLANPNLKFPGTLMPAARQLQLSLRDLQALAAYCKHGEFRAAAAPTRGSPESSLPPSRIAAAGASEAVALVTREMPMVGRQVFARECLKCHSLNGAGGKAGMPGLITGRSPRSRDWLERMLKDPKSVLPNAVMPPTLVAGPEFLALLDFVTHLQMGPPGSRPGTSGTSGRSDAHAPPSPAVLAQAMPEVVDRLDRLTREVEKLRTELRDRPADPNACEISEPPPALPELPAEVMQKAVSLYSRHCLGCHVVDGVEGLTTGGTLGPKFLKGSSLHSREHMLRIVEEPKSVFGNATIMTPLKLPDPAERDALIDFMLRITVAPKAAAHQP